MYAGVKFEIVEHGSERYLAAVRLRDAILVNPAGVVTTAEAGAIRMKRVAVASRLQGGGLGTRMLRFCEDHARAIGASELRAHARETAVRFYVKNGFATEGEYFEEAGIPHVVVRKQIGQARFHTSESEPR